MKQNVVSYKYLNINTLKCFSVIFNCLELININVVGIMTIGSFTNNMSIVVKEFEMTKKIFDNLKSTFPNLKTLSMGMSSDYKMAINHGSNMIRVGSLIFGKRI